MTEQQQQFADEYLIDLNATQAAIRAGYSQKTAGSQGERLLKNVEIQEYIQKKRQKLSNRLEITAERVLNEYARIAFADPRKFFDGVGDLNNIDDLEDDDAAVVASVEVYKENIRAGEETIGEAVTKKVKFWDKLRALDSLGKHLGLFEKDNSQKQPIVNLNSLSTDDMKALLAIKKKVA